jgi:hypothetical protein
MNNEVTFDIHRIAQFKNWVRGRFISEIDIHAISPEDAFAWSVALIELGVCIQQISLGKAVLSEVEGKEHE